MKKIALALSLLGVTMLSSCNNGGNSVSSALTLNQVQQDNLKFFQVGVGVESRTFMPLDTIYVNKTTGEVTVPKMFFNTTEVGLYLNILQLIAESKITTPVISSAQALAQMLKITQELLILQNSAGKSWKGLFYWPYNIESDGSIVPGSSTIPDVDNSNLDFSLAAVVGAYQNSSDPLRLLIAENAKTIIGNQQDGWTTLAGYTKGQSVINPDCQECVAAGWDTSTNQPLGYFIDRMANESRLSPLWMLIHGYSTQNGAFTQMPIYSNNTTLNGESSNVEMTWDGTIFQLLLPRILLREDQLVPNYQSIFNTYVGVQQQYIESNGIIAFLSASSGTDDNYYSFGVPSENECYTRGWCSLPPFINGTPHATALIALENPALSLNYFNQLYQCKNTLNPYGLYDAIGLNCLTGTEMISLDQGMLVLGLAGNTIADYVGDYIKSLNKWQLVESLYQSYRPVPYN